MNPHGLGDIIMMFPLLKCLRDTRPKCISLSVKSQIEADIIHYFFPSILLEHIIIVSSFKRTNNSIVAFIKYVRSIQKISPDIVLSVFNVHPMLSSIASILSMAKIRVGFSSHWDFLFSNIAVFQPEKHKVFQHLALLDTLNGKKKRIHPLFPSFIAQNKATDKVVKLLKASGVTMNNHCIIGIAPGSGNFEKHKRWPGKKFAELIQLIQTLPNVYALIIGSSQEYSLSQEIMKSVNDRHRVINMTGKTTIIETAHALRICRVVIANCNGLSHLSGSVGTTVIGLYGPTDPFFTGVFSPDLTIIQKKMRCIPCYCRENTSGCGNPVCMRHISVHEVFESLKKYIVDV